MANQRLDRRAVLRRALLPALVLALVAPADGRSQPAVAPAGAVRVIEVVDPWTGARARHVAEDLTAAEIARVQRALSAAGFDPGRATGNMNPLTRSALGRFQASRGLDRCDCVSYETVVALGVRPLVVARIRSSLGRRSDVLVLVPHRGRGVRVGHQSAIVVGHGPSVFVGHEPAGGAGKHGGGFHPRDPRPARPRPGVSAAGAGAPLRALTPRSPSGAAPSADRALATP